MTFEQPWGETIAFDILAGSDSSISICINLLSFHYKSKAPKTRESRNGLLPELGFRLAWMPCIGFKVLLIEYQLHGKERQWQWWWGAVLLLFNSGKSWDWSTQVVGGPACNLTVIANGFCLNGGVSAAFPDKLSRHRPCCSVDTLPLSTLLLTTHSLTNSETLTQP